MRIWTRQPQVPVRPNPYWARGMLSLVVAGQSIDLFSRKQLTFSSVTNGFESQGKVWTLANGVANKIDSPHNGVSNASGFMYSGIALIRPTGASDVEQIVININYDGTTVPFSLSIGSPGSSSVLDGCAFFNGSGWVGTDITTDIRTANTWNLVGGTINNATSNMRYYINGKIDASTTNSSTNTNVNTQPVSYGIYTAGGGSVAFRGDIALGAVWYGRELTPSEMFALWQNPWQLCEPLPRLIHSPAPAVVAGGSPLVGRTRLVYSNLTHGRLAA